MANKTTQTPTQPDKPLFLVHVEEGVVKAVHASSVKEAVQLAKQLVKSEQASTPPVQTNQTEVNN